MKSKKLLNLFAILIGVFMCFCFSKVYAEDSNFGDANITRGNLRNVAEANSLRGANNTPVTLSISKFRNGQRTGEVYIWGPASGVINSSGRFELDDHYNVDANKIWKISTVTSDNTNNYDDLYYCLDVQRGFGLTNGEMAEGATDTYSVEYNVNDSEGAIKELPSTNSNLSKNYNKILWILDNSYIPTKSSSYKESDEYKEFKERTNLKFDLTEEQIEVVQQMAIWYFTNQGYIGNNTPAIFAKNESLTAEIGREDGEIYTAQMIMEDLYKYFIREANNHSTYTRNIPTLTLGNTNATVTENGNFFKVGPFTLNGTNTEIINEITANITPAGYTLLNSSGNAVSGNNFKNVIGSTFYLQYNKSDITSSTDVNIELEYKYNCRNLVVKTSTRPDATQPVVLVKPGEETKKISTNIRIELTGKYDLVLVKEDENGEDLNSTATFEVNGQTETVTGRLTVADDVQITSANVGTVDVYTIKELVPPDEYCKFDGVITVTVTKSVSNGKYVASNVSYTVTGGDSSDVRVYLNENGNIYVEVKNYPEEIPAQPDLALRKYITKVGNTAVTDRIPRITDTDKLDDDDAANHTAKYTHPKNVVSVKKGDTVEYSITIYNEGKVAARASKITDQIPAGLKFLGVVSGNYEKESYDETTNRLVLKETSSNSDIAVFEKGRSLNRTTVVVKCEVLDSAEENKNLTNIAWISEMKKGNEVFTADIDSQTTTSPTCAKDSMADYEGNGNDNGYYKGQQDDDDFDRVIVIPEEIPAQPDLALRKFITKIGDKTYNREPQIGTWTLDNGKTVTKTHSKDAITVKENDIVTYTIRVYNEGNVKGKPTEVTDYLPAGLTLADSSVYEVNRNWQPQQTLASGYTPVKIAYNQRDLNAYVEGQEPDYVDFEIVCKVTATAGENTKNLKNIAEITGAQYERGDSDRDSTPGDVHANSSYNPTNPTTGRGEQDDDDFEELVLDAIDNGELKIKLLKVDESENKITSSNAQFEIKEGNNAKQTLTTSSGELDLGTKTITGTNFEYTYIIKETQAPAGYQTLNDELSLKIAGTVKKENNKYVIDEITLKDKDGNELDNSKIKAEYDRASNTVIIKIKDKKIENEYSLRILKVNQDGTQVLDNAWFKINTSNDMTNVQAQKISVDGNILTTGRLSSTDNLELTYYLQETEAPEGYIKDETLKEVKIKSNVVFENGQYKLSNVRLDPAVNGIELSTENNVITIKVKNNPEVITGKYKVVVKKVDTITGEVIPASKGARFRIYNSKINKTMNLGEGEIENVDITSANDINLQYNIEETQAPTGYNRIEGIKTASAKLKVVKNGTSWKVTRMENVQTTDSSVEMLLDSNNTNTIIIKVKDTPIKKDFDLALRKFITAVNNKEFKNSDGTYAREPKVDTTNLKNKTATTATYKHSKYPVSVQKGDVVTYTIRVYNEGELDGYVNKIADYLPSYLQPLLAGISDIDSEKYKNEIKFNTDRLWTLGENNKVETEITNKNNQSAVDMYGEGGLILSKFNGGNDLDFIDVQIKCLVKNDPSLDPGTYLTNIAEIVDAEDENGEHWDGNDSALNGLKNNQPTDTSDLFNYKNTEALASNPESYIPGQEDDDDFEKLIVESFDLSLRKYITAINNEELKTEDGSYTREPKVDASKLGQKDANGNLISTAIYTHPKDAREVKKGDIITYTLRVYNEGTIDGYANQIIDYIPAGLEFIKNSAVNIANEWKMLDKDGNETSDPTQAVIIVTDNKSQSKALQIDGGRKADSNVILNRNARNKAGELDYVDVKVQFKVTADPKTFMGKELVNYAEIGEDSNNDIDSTPINGHGDKTSKEDDDDFEPVKLVYFDLALRKFITNANGIDYNNRVPEVDTSKYGTVDEKGNKITSFTYKHTKDPVVVTTGSTVVYTIRVYNEGTMAGYAQEITDNIPEGLQFLPENETNTEFKWKMLDQDGNITQDATKAKKITTAYLAQDLLDAYQKANGTEIISYKDVKVAFKVIEPNTSNRVVINTAEISKASDEDIDSTPGNNDSKEDDIDNEYLKVKYFDLALKKWVTATRVIYNGKTTETKTGFNEDSTEIAKVDLVAKRLKKTTVKFVYNIKVINEGEVAGYATEIEDYIPKGLMFLQEDNPKWKLVEDDVAVTDQLKDKLLQPGETATIEIVLTWKNSTTNMGLKTNWAEIKNDSDDDIDSVPDNKREHEDDIDDAKVILSIKTGTVRTYILLTLISITILAGGAFAIKKYVLK